MCEDRLSLKISLRFFTNDKKFLLLELLACVIYESSLLAAQNSWIQSTGNIIIFSPILTIFRILVNKDIIDMSYDISCHGNHFGGKLCITIVNNILYYYMGWCSSNTGCTPMCDTAMFESTVHGWVSLDAPLNWPRLTWS